MTLLQWLKEHHPGRGGPTVLVRLSETSYPTVRKALRGEPVANKKAREKLSAATGGVVTVEQLELGTKRKRARRAA